MNTQQTFSDEELTAYLDGEFEHCPKEAIEAALATDVGVQQRLAELDFDKMQFQSAMQDLLKQAPPMPNLNEVTLSEPKAANDNLRFGGNGLIAASLGVLMLGIGALGGFLANQPDQETWQDYVAYYQVLYVEETLQYVDFEEANALEELTRVSNVLERELPLAEMQNVSGLTYKRAQILGFNEKPLAQMTFLTEDGTPIALCIIKSQGNSDNDVSTTTLKSLATATWANDGYEFMVIGGEDHELVRSLATQFKNTI